MSARGGIWRRRLGKWPVGLGWYEQRHAARPLHSTDAVLHGFWPVSYARLRRQPTFRAYANLLEC